MSHVVNCPCCGSLLNYANAVLQAIAATPQANKMLAASQPQEKNRRLFALTDAGRAVVKQMEREADARRRSPAPIPARRSTPSPAALGPIPPMMRCPHGRNTILSECMDCAAGRGWELLPEKTSDNDDDISDEEIDEWIEAARLASEEDV